MRPYLTPMPWILIAILGHLSNGVAFVIDKILLRSAFARSATYAGLVGLLSTVLVLAVPFVHFWPQGDVWLAAAVSGAGFVFALWAFFASLARAEASRVVPIVGSLIPMFTLAGAFVFLGERLADMTFVGFFILIIATVLLSGGKRGHISHTTIWMSVASALLFALSSITGKAVYENAGFLGGFIATRLFDSLTSLFILCVLDREAGREALKIFFPSLQGSSKDKQPGRLAAFLAIIGQCLGALGFVLVQYAISMGSASIVNALQAVQYAFLVLFAIAMRSRARALLGEDLERHVLLRKVAALILTALGMYLIVV